MPSQSESNRDAQQPLLQNGSSSVYHATQHTAPETEGNAAKGTFTKNLGAIEAFGIITAIVIGSGIFTSPGSIDANVPSPGMALVVWVIGGILAWTGATTFAELGTAIPGEGGVQPWLQRMYGENTGFLAAWTWIVCNQPSTLAIDSIVFVESVYSAAGINNQSDSMQHKLFAVLFLVIMSVANSFSTKASTRLNSFFVVVKFVGVFVIVVSGVSVLCIHATTPQRDVGGHDWADKPWFEYRKTHNPDGTETNWLRVGDWEMFGYFCTALYAALWAYSGWDKAVYVSAELSNPSKQLPLAVNTALPIIIVCFLLANAAYYVLLPWNIISTTDSIAVTAVMRLLGHGFSIAMAVLICVVVAGALLGNSFVASRMAVAAANKGWIPSLFKVVGRIGPAHASDMEDESSSASGKATSDAPINAVILSVVLGSLFIIFGSFRQLLTLNGLGEYVFFLLTVIGAVVLRYREPALHRPYKPFLVLPILFVVVATFVVIRGAVFAPREAMVLVAVWLVGLSFRWMKTSYFDA